GSPSSRRLPSHLRHVPVVDLVGAHPVRARGAPRPDIRGTALRVGVPHPVTTAGAPATEDRALAAAAPTLAAALRPGAGHVHGHTRRTVPGSRPAPRAVHQPGLVVLADTRRPPQPRLPG